MWWGVTRALAMTRYIYTYIYPYNLLHTVSCGKSVLLLNILSGVMGWRSCSRWQVYTQIYIYKYTYMLYHCEHYDDISHRVTSWGWYHIVRMVPGLPIRDCARSCNSSEHMRTTMCATHVTAKTFFERFYLVLGLRQIALWVNCPYAPTTLPIHITTISRFLSQLSLCTHHSDHSLHNYFSISVQFFSPNGPSIFLHHDSPSNLAESRYPHREHNVYISSWAFLSHILRSSAFACVRNCCSFLRSL